MGADQTSGERGEGRVVGIICRTAWRCRKRSGIAGWPPLWMFDAPGTWRVRRHYLCRSCSECCADRASLAKGQKTPDAIFNHRAETKNGEVSLHRSQAERPPSHSVTPATPELLASATTFLLFHERREKVNRHRQKRGRVVLARNLLHGLQEPELESDRLFRNHRRRLDELFRRLKFSFCINNFRAPLSLGLGFLGHLPLPSTSANN